MSSPFPCVSYHCAIDSNTAMVWIYMLLSMLVQTDVRAQSWEYDYYRALDYDGKYVLGWRYNATDIEFEITAQTLGYVGFGISQTGDMYPADIAIGWINDGQMFLGVRHIQRFNYLFNLIIVSLKNQYGML